MNRILTSIRPRPDKRPPGVTVPLKTALALLASTLLSLGFASEPKAAGSPAGDPAANFEFRVSADGERVHFQGYIDFGVTQALSTLLEQETDIVHLRLESGGGLVAEARGLVRLIGEYGLTTSAVGDCSSACTLVFIAGHTRYLEPDARLGFHQYAQRSPVVEFLMKQDPGDEQQSDFELFRRARVDEAFLTQIMNTPHQQMWYPAVSELVASGVVDILGLPAATGGS